MRFQNTHIKKFGKAHLLCLLLLCLSNAPNAFAQFGNEWIDYDQSYWEFSIAQDGIVILDYETLLAAGFPVNSVDPAAIQIYNRANEQHILVVGGDDGTFDSSDYIEIYCQKNDGWQDAQMYDLPENQNNPNYSLFNDTIAYYLSVSDNLNNLRTEQFFQNNYDDFLLISYCRNFIG